MTSLIASIGEDNGTWAHVKRVISSEEFESVFIVAQPSVAEKFSADKEIQFILIDGSKAIPELVEDIHSQMKDKKFGVEVAVNMVSGPGKEHMAMLSAILRLGVGLRLIVLTKDGVKEV